MPKTPPSASAGSGIVSGKQIYTVLIHADALLPRMLRQRAMQAFGNPQLELTGVVLEIVRLPDRQAVLQSRLQPCSLGISRIGR